MDDWWGEMGRGVIQAVAWTVIMGLVMAWVARSRLKSRPAGDAGRLHHPASTLIVGMTCLLFFGGMAIASRLFNPEHSLWFDAVFGGFALLSIPILADYILSRYEISDEGMKYRKLWGGSGYLKWSDLRAVRYAPVMKWFRLEAASGDVARVSVMLVGLPELARVLLRHAPPESIAPDTLPVLKATAGGDPPSVW